MPSPDLAARFDAATAALRAAHQTEAVNSDLTATVTAKAERSAGVGRAAADRAADHHRARAAPRGGRVGSSQRDYPWLRGALVKLAHDDPGAAARLLLRLVPVQGAVVESRSSTT